MTDHNEDLKPLAIEGKLPLKAVGIENLREAHPTNMPPHRYLHRWFARRPTPVARLATLASVLPKDTETDELLELMQFGPKEGVDKPLDKYIEEKKATEDDRSGTLSDHYGYPRPFKLSPSTERLDELHNTLRSHWDGEIPSVIDPTAGGGVIPYESVRYRLPTYANELNSVPSLILKAILYYAPTVGDITPELENWANKINERAKDKLSQYFPSGNGRDQPDNYVCTYSVTCSSCGRQIPLVPKWRVRTRTGAETVIVHPSFSEDGSLEFACWINPTDEELGDFDPTDGPVSRGGDAECLNCGVVSEADEIKQRIADGDYRDEIYCVRTHDSDGSFGFRAPNEDDYAAMEAATDKVSSSFELSSLLSADIPEGQKTSEPLGWGLEQWRDMFTDRQLVSHYEFLDAVNHFRSDIYEKHDEEEAEAILSLITLTAGKLVDYNSRLSGWDTVQGFPNPLSKDKNYAFKRIYPDNNLTTGGLSFLSQLDRVSESYAHIVEYLPEDAEPASVTNQDAASLPYEDDSLQAAIIDPPYYSSVMYAELSDVYYAWMKEYLKDTFPELFGPETTDKSNEAVANSSRFEDVAGEVSKKQLARDFYEEKMDDIFSELSRIIEPGGVMTVMFTHKETDAWDTLTMSLINSGFTITSTHPITSEMPQRAGMRSSASADTTLLLTGRKPHEERDPENAVPTLWSDVEADTREAAKDAARDLLKSGISLTKTDVIISAFGPTLRVFADAYPVVDDQDEEVPPRKALETAREAVTQILVDEYLEGMDVDTLDDITEWYILCWLVHEAETFSYDDGRQLGLGIGVDIDEIKRSTKTWRKSRGDISLRGHDGRVQNINEKPEDRSSRLPVDPGDLSFPRSLDAVHAAMHVYDKRGETETIEWLRERNFDSDSQFKATLKALLQVLPHNHEDWELARDLAVGRTSDVLDLDFSPNVFAEDDDDTSQSTLGEH